MAEKKDLISDEQQEFESFWNEKGETAMLMMSEFERVIILVDGKPRKGATSVTDSVIVLSKWGLQRATLANDQLLSGAIISPEEAIRVYRKSKPNDSFMEKVRSGYSALFR